MSELNPPRRRRRPQGVVVPPEEEEPHRIVIGDEGDEPEWLVSAGKISGAASRRVQSMKPEQHAKRAEAREEYSQTRGKTEGREVLRLKKKPEQANARGKANALEQAAKPEAGEDKAKREYAAVGEITVRQSESRAKPRTASSGGGTKRKPAKKKGSRKAQERRLKAVRGAAMTTLCAAVLVALLVGGVVGGGRLIAIKQTLDRGDGVFYPNIFVNDIPLEGKTLDEAAYAVSQQVTSLIASWKITLRTQDGRSWDITGSDLNMSYDVADQLDQLWAIGHTGSSSTRYEQVKALEEEPAMRYTKLSYDMSAVTQILTQIKSEVDRAPVSATRVDDDTQWPPFSYTDDVAGQTLDITGLNERICAMVDKLESGVVDLTPTSVEAPITRAYLESQIVRLSTYETALATSGSEGRHENVRIGTEKFNHLIIKANETVSFNKVTGKRNAKNGYYPALELAYGQYVEGYGGGICQVSSTLYNAVVNAGLQVVTRYQHSLASSYVPMGLDATVQDDRLDFVFKNNTGADIYIETSYYREKGQYHTRFTIYGRPDPNGYTYKLESQVVETLPIPEATYKPDEDMTYVIYDDEEPYLDTKGKEGYVVDVYLVTMDSSGLEVSRALDHTDTYKATTPVYYVGTQTRETPTPEVTY
ncbi:MAG: VanW family protein [Clostridia bacterium]|nr:VanW family protein [Clostridia bacterium]